MGFAEGEEGAHVGEILGGKSGEFDAPGVLAVALDVFAKMPGGLAADRWAGRAGAILPMARAAGKIDAIEGWLRGVEQFLSVVCVADEAVDVIVVVIVIAAAAEKLGNGVEILMRQVGEFDAFGVRAVALRMGLQVRR